MNHLLSATDQFAHVEAHHGGGHHPEIRERRVPPADAGKAMEDMSEVVRLGDFLQLRPWVGDGDETLAGLGGADGTLDALEEVLLEDVRLRGGAGLAGDDEE